MDTVGGHFIGIATSPPNCLKLVKGGTNANMIQLIDPEPDPNRDPNDPINDLASRDFVKAVKRNGNIFRFLADGIVYSCYRCSPNHPMNAVRSMSDIKNP